MWLLKERGCCHDDRDGNWFKGPIGEPRTMRLEMDSRLPWFTQVINACRGGKYAFDLEDRAKHMAMLEDTAREAQQARDSYGTKSIIPRSQPDVPVRMGSINAPAGEPELSSFYEARQEEPIIVSTTSVNAVGATRRKANLPSNVHETVDKRRREQERLPRARGPKVVEITEDMDVDENAPADNDQGESPETLQQEQPESADEEVPRKRSRKASASLPAISQQQKDVKYAFGLPDPEAILLQSFRQKFAPYSLVINAGNALTREMANMVRSSAEASRIRTVPDPWAGVGEPGTLKPGPGGVVLVNSLSYSELVNHGHILTSPYITFELLGPTSAVKHDALIDTGAEVNVLPYELALSIGCKISQTDLTMTTATEERVPFDGMTSIRVELDRESKIGCDCMFFLRKGSEKTLLGQPFVRDTRMVLEFEESGQMNGVFTDPESHETVKMMVVPPPRKRSATQYQARVDDASERANGAALGGK